MHLFSIQCRGFILRGSKLGAFSNLNGFSRIFCHCNSSAVSSGSINGPSDFNRKWARSEDGSLDPTGTSDLSILISRINSGSCVNAIVRSLLHDPVCETIKVDHGLVIELLTRFKNDWKSALGTFRWAESCAGFTHTPEGYDMMVDILGKTGQFDKMRELVDEMCQSNMVTLKTIAKMTRRLAGADMWMDAVRVFDKLGTYGLEKNSESMNLLLNALCKENQVELAREIFLELKPHILPNANTFNILILGWCKVNQVEEAHWTIQEMKGHGFSPCVISYTTVIQSYCLQSNYNRVYELLDEMDSQECPANVVTYTAIISSLTKTEKFEESLRIAERMKLAGCKPDTLFYNALIHTLGRAGQVKEAVHVFEKEMHKSGVSPNTSTFNTMIAMFCRGHNEQKAFMILSDMERSRVCKPDVQTFYPLLKSCFRTGQVEGMLSKLLDDMTNKYHLSFDVSAYTLLINGLCRANQTKWAYHLFEQMIGQELRPRTQTCRLLLDDLKQNRMDDAVEKVEGYMKQMKAFKPSSCFFIALRC